MIRTRPSLSGAAIDTEIVSADERGGFELGVGWTGLAADPLRPPTAGRSAPRGSLPAVPNGSGATLPRCTGFSRRRASTAPRCKPRSTGWWTKPTGRLGRNRLATPPEVARLLGPVLESVAEGKDVEQALADFRGQLFAAKSEAGETGSMP